MFCLTARLALGASAASLLLAACSGAGSSVSGQTTPGAGQQSPMRQASSASRIVDTATGRTELPAELRPVPAGVRENSSGWMSADAKGTSPKVYVSDPMANAVYIYNAKNPTTPIGTITKGISAPYGNFVDSRGILYVANRTGNSITVYAKGKTTPSKTYTTGLSQPFGVAVGKDGTVYVSEFISGQVLEYDKGATTPSRTIAIYEAEGVALDAKNNLYVSYINPNTAQGGVEKFKPKATTGTDLGIAVGFAGDLKIDTQNDLILGDQSTQAIDFYKPGATTPYGSISGGVDPFKIALNSTEKLLYDATASNSVVIFDAMPGGTSVGTIASGLQSAYGVSVTPPAPLN